MKKDEGISKPDQLLHQNFDLRQSFDAETLLLARQSHPRKGCAPAATFPTCHWQTRLLGPTAEGLLPAIQC